MKKLLLILYSLLFGGLCFAQDVQKTDSLKRLLNSAKEDTGKAILYLNLARAYEDHDIKTAMAYAKQGGQLSEKLHYTAGILKYNKRMMYMYATLQQHDSAIQYGNQILKIAMEMNDSLNIGIAYFALGERYNYKSDYETGIAYSLKGLRIIERVDTTLRTKSIIYGSLAANYLMIKDYKKSIEFGEKAEQINRNTNVSKELASTLLNLGNAWDELGQEDKAMKIYKEALSICEQYNYNSYIPMACEGLTSIMEKQNNVDQIKYYADKGLAKAIEIADSAAIMNANNSLGIYYLKISNFSKAKEHLFTALRISNTNDYKEARGMILQTLSNVFFAAHDYDQASKYQREATSIKEEIFTELTAQKLANEEVKYETEKKENQISLQQAVIKQKSTLNYFLIAGLAALLIIALLGYRSYRNRQKLQQSKINELETEKQLTATEAVLKGEAQERTRLAKDLHDGLGGMLSGIKFSLSNMKENLIMTPDNAQAFERSIDMLDSSIKEMRRVAHNLMPEMLVKYGLDTALKEFCNEVSRSTALHVNYQSMNMSNFAINQAESAAIYRIVQELVNNAMKHAQAREVLVQLHYHEAEKTLAITVEDDGKGFDKTMLQEAQGIGWKNIESRVEFLKGKMDLQSAPGKGTSVLIEISMQ